MVNEIATVFDFPFIFVQIFRFFSLEIENCNSMRCTAWLKVHQICDRHRNVRGKKNEPCLKRMEEAENLSAKSLNEMKRAGKTRANYNVLTFHLEEAHSNLSLYFKGQ